MGRLGMNECELILMDCLYFLTNHQERTGLLDYSLFATLLNCSNRFFGKKVKTVYLLVTF